MGDASPKTPDTKERVESMLLRRGLAPNHRLSQNFLVMPKVLDRILLAADVQAGELVLEVGPGSGVLTERLLLQGAELLAVEIDRGLYSFLAETFAHEERLELLHADIMDGKSRLNPLVLSALETRMREHPSRPWRVVANLPYGVSSPFLVSLALLPRPPRSILVMLQEEVGDALLAKPGGAAYTPLSFVGRLAWIVERVFMVPRSAFFPVPKVGSCLMRLCARDDVPEGLQQIVGFVRRLFLTRRKTLSSVLHRLIKEDHGKCGVPESVIREGLAAAGLSESDRAESADPMALARLARHFDRILGPGSREV